MMSRLKWRDSVSVPGVFGLALLLSSLGSACAGKSRSPKNSTQTPPPSAVPVSVNQEQNDSLGTTLQLGIQSNWKGDLAGFLETHYGYSTSDSSLISEALSKIILNSFSQAAQSGNHRYCPEAPPESACGLDVALNQLFNQSSQIKLLMEQALSSLKEEHKAQAAQLDELSQKLSQWLPKWLEKMQEPEFKAQFLESISLSLKDLSRELQLYLYKEVSVDAPFLEEGFFKDATFVLTTSFQQASVGRERMYNLQSFVVKLKEQGSRLLLLQDSSGQFDSSNGVDVVLASYPILRTVVQKETGKRYLQTDFSKPDNKQFVVRYLDPATPGLQLSADVVVPRLVQAQQKTPLGTDGFVVGAEQSSLVLDQLILLNGNMPLFSDDSLPLTAPLGKDAVRPTIQLVQGLFRLDPKEDSFTRLHPTSDPLVPFRQAVPLAEAQSRLAQLGVDGLDTTKGAAYFTADPFLPASGGRARNLSLQARKMNLAKPIVFVLSPNTPPKAAPTLRAAVKSYEKVLLGLSPSALSPQPFEVLTYAEFLKKNESEGLKLGDAKPLAADPRVNMLLWDEGVDLGAAWATASAHPITGEVISADVMLSGHMWAKIGCEAYFQRQWNTSSERPTNQRPASKVPSAITKYIWNLSCETTLNELGFYSDDTYADENPVTGKEYDSETLETITKLTQKGDNEAMESLASRLIPAPLWAKWTQAKAQDPSVLALSEIQRLRQKFAPLDLSITNVMQKWEQKRLELKKWAYPSMSLETSGISPTFEKSNHLSTFAGKWDCQLDPKKMADQMLSAALVPGLTSTQIKSPKEAALALLKMVTAHELGHAFGLRHNFIASQKQSPLTQVAGIPVSTRTDSIMDYNDYGVELDLGAMSQVDTGEVSPDVAELGAYDVLALSALYGLDLKGDTAASTQEKKVAFCTDDDVAPLMECQRFDFGNSYTDYLMLRTNTLLETLRSTMAIDGILTGGSSGVEQTLGAYLSASQELILRFAASLSASQQRGDLSAKKALTNLAHQIFYAPSDLDSQKFLEAFKNTVGRDPKGVLQQLQPQVSDFYEQSFAAILAEIIHENNSGVLRGVLKNVQEVADGDRRFFSHLKDAKFGDKTYSFATDLFRLYEKTLFIPAGTALDFEVLLDGKRVPGSQFKLGGNPVQVTLNTPFWNYLNQTLFLKEGITVDLPDGSGTQKVIPTIKGGSGLSKMVVDVATLSLLDGGFEGSRSFKIVSQMRSQLEQLLKNDCGTDSPVGCYTISAANQEAARWLSQVLKDAEALASGKL
jgi:hypothetical protein